MRFRFHICIWKKLAVGIKKFLNNSKSNIIKSKLLNKEAQSLSTRIGKFHKTYPYTIIFFFSSPSISGKKSD